MILFLELLVLHWGLIGTMHDTFVNLLAAFTLKKGLSPSFFNKKRDLNSFAYIPLP